MKQHLWESLFKKNLYQYFNFSYKIYFFYWKQVSGMKNDKLRCCQGIWTLYDIFNWCKYFPNSLNSLTEKDTFKYLLKVIREIRALYISTILKIKPAAQVFGFWHYIADKKLRCLKQYYI